jgi:hypothetical protein
VRLPSSWTRPPGLSTGRRNCRSGRNIFIHFHILFSCIFIFSLIFPGISFSIYFSSSSPFALSPYFAHPPFPPHSFPPLFIFPPFHPSYHLQCDDAFWFRVGEVNQGTGSNFRGNWFWSLHTSFFCALTDSVFQNALKSGRPFHCTSFCYILFQGLKLETFNKQLRRRIQFSPLRGCFF